jgi:ribokinase
MAQPKVVVVGSINTDMVVKGTRLPGPGETIVGGQFVMVPGGKGANQAVAAARLGADVTLIGKVGNDVFGDQSVENFRREGIATHSIFRDATTATGVALILVDAKGENSISVASGANHTITPEEIGGVADRFRQADVLMLQLEIPMETTVAAAEIAFAAGVTVILDPAPAAPLPDRLLQNVTYLTPNESEAEGLTGIAVNDEASARCAAEKLLAAGAKNVLITLGAKGALLADVSGMTLIPTVKINAIDTTAAGDAFNGGLAWALGAGMTREHAVKKACLVGALSATRLGAQPSLPTPAELEQFANSFS